MAPRQHSTGRKRLLRRMLIIGAHSIVGWRARKEAAAGIWLAQMLARKPPVLVRVALANDMAQLGRALTDKGGAY